MLKRLEGNPGKRKLGNSEPAPIGALQAPPFLVGGAAEEWERVVSSMPPGFFTAADYSTLAVYCFAWDMHKKAVETLAVEGILAEGSTKQQVAHPALGVLATQAGVILKAGDRLGLSPGARSRLQVPEVAAQKSKFEGLISITGGRQG
jgi:P27 family predicted phage terminase small subunit